MDYRKYNLMNMHIEKIKFYSLYVDSISRIINDYMLNGDENLKSYDVPNLMELLTIFSHALRIKVLQMYNDWEFYK